MVNMRVINKHLRLNVAFFFALLLGLASCGGGIPKDEFDVNLLYGKWQEGTVFERYYETEFERILPNGDTVKANGTTWDEQDDVMEEEAQLFNWTLTGATLKHEHVGAFIIVPKIYTVSTLTSSELVYHDDYGTTHHLTKVE